MVWAVWAALVGDGSDWDRMGKLSFFYSRIWARFMIIYEILDI